MCLKRGIGTNQGPQSIDEHAWNGVFANLVVDVGDADVRGLGSSLRQWLGWPGESVGSLYGCEPFPRPRQFCCQPFEFLEMEGRQAFKPSGALFRETEPDDTVIVTVTDSAHQA